MNSKGRIGGRREVAPLPVCTHGLPRGRDSSIMPGPLLPRPEPILGSARSSEDLLNFFLSEPLVPEHHDSTVTLR
jgi:hypothetical protein